MVFIKPAAPAPDSRCPIFVLAEPIHDVLHAKYLTKRVNHSEEFRSDEGVTNNLAESLFSRFRRMQYGQMHHFSKLYLSTYANEAAYREDRRRWDNGKIFKDILSKCANTLTSKNWCEYWQGNKKQVAAYEVQWA